MIENFHMSFTQFLDATIVNLEKHLACEIPKIIDLDSQKDDV